MHLWPRSNSGGTLCLWADSHTNPVQLCAVQCISVVHLLSVAVPTSCADLEPKRKAYLMQNIMASKYIVAQQKRLQASPTRAADTGGLSHLHQSHHPGGALGCAHYKRRLAKLCISCGRILQDCAVSGVLG